MAARTTAVVSFAICFIFGVGCSWRGAVANDGSSWGGCVDNGNSCGVASKLSNRFLGALAGARFFFGFRPRLLGIGKHWYGSGRLRISYPLLANAVQRLLTVMVASTPHRFHVRRGRRRHRPTFQQASPASFLKPRYTAQPQKPGLATHWLCG